MLKAWKPEQRSYRGAPAGQRDGKYLGKNRETCLAVTGQRQIGIHRLRQRAISCDFEIGLAGLRELLVPRMGVTGVRL